ncbi:TIGR03084 family metal-binding protein [Haloechinothrix sp. LS1_15]|uniref:TIGR03084 family metal-binding protein n=1 Tax=Haloechinothrix sp. LS1_15 TaxID=2652248 RepID=UPI002944C77F|nr:TIGR03084 family metal-binding protein [Haloechinothrix sp. LS1_15]MDV6014071.1 TIGR03084 family protein [Haloechinothrix sp. LS1_15]
MVDVASVLADLDAEGEELDACVAGLPAGEWARDTPAPGWTIAHQIAHLAWTDDVAHLAVTDPEAFQERLAEAAADPEGFVDAAAAHVARRAPGELLEHWRDRRGRLCEALAGRSGDEKVPWFGPPMRPASMATARIMETWAHGQDVADALGIEREPTARLRHVAHIGVRTRDFAFHAHGLTPPHEPFRVELAAPDGDLWTWGPDSAEQRVTGSALGFCLLVTQRRHPDDTDVTARGAEAARWLTIAQAFAGPPGQGRKAGQF